MLGLHWTYESFDPHFSSKMGDLAHCGVSNQRELHVKKVKKNHIISANLRQWRWKRAFGTFASQTTRHFHSQLHQRHQRGLGSEVHVKGGFHAPCPPTTRPRPSVQSLTGASTPSKVCLLTHFWSNDSCHEIEDYSICTVGCNCNCESSSKKEY